jgi:sugar O-acyltransferase (sialic acid O-acetyltransferase NeuD family)
MKNEYVIFGSGGLAKEIIGYLIEMHGHNHGIRAVVSTELFNNRVYNEMFSVRESLKPNEFPDAKFILAVAEPKTKRAIVEKNEDRWTTFIHSSASISPFARYGKGCVFTAQTILAGDPEIGDFVFLNTNATIGHDAIVGSYTTMFPNTEICGNCIIGEDCVFGIGSYVVPNVTLPSKTKVGAGSVVWKSVEESCLLVGNPAAPKIRS